jgi:DUF971 family protein
VKHEKRSKKGMNTARQRKSERNRQKSIKYDKEKHNLMILCCHHSYLMLSILIIRLCAPAAAKKKHIAAQILGLVGGRDIELKKIHKNFGA